MLYLEVTPESVKVEELAGFGAIAGSLHFPSDKYVAAQETHLCPHVHPIHHLTHVQEHRFTYTYTHTELLHTILCIRY